MQQRNDLSDADETDIKKKKRKRPLTDNSRSAVKSKNTLQSPRKSQKVALTESGKNVIKIPVGGALGALSGVRNLNQPSPAKRPRTSKSKSSKVNAQTSVGGIKATSGADARTMIPAGTISGAAPGVMTSSGTPQSTPGFISLAAKGGTSVLKPSVTQSYLTVSGSPSIIKQNNGSVQYIIKPQSQRQLPIQTGAVTHTSNSVTQSTSGAAGVRYTSLSPSPTSPFTSVLNLKGNVTSQGILGVGSAAAGARTNVSTTGIRTVLGQHSDALKRTISGKPVVGGQVLPSQHIGLSMAQLSSTSTLSTSLQSSHMTTTASGSLVRSSTAVPQKGTTAGLHIQGSAAGQVSKSLQMNTQRSLGAHSQVRYIVGPSSTASHPGTVLVTTQGGMIRAVSNVQQGRTSSPQLSTVKSYSPSTITAATQQRASPALSGAATCRPQSAPAKVPTTITYVLTSSSGVRSASPLTSVSSKSQVCFNDSYLQNLIHLYDSYEPIMAEYLIREYNIGRDRGSSLTLK